MKSIAPLTGSYLRTYERIFQHPISHNLERHDVRSLLGKLGHVAEEHNGNLKVTRNGQTLVLHPASTKDVVEMDELMALRHFLERSETASSVTDEKEIHWLLVIDHHEARVFQTQISDGLPLQILPHKPGDYFRHAHNSKEFSRGQEKPDPNNFFEPVVKVLRDIGPILIFGTGTGTSSEMDQFNKWLKLHHPAVANRVLSSLVVDEHHLTEGELLAKARDFYAKALTSSAEKP